MSHLFVRIVASNATFSALQRAENSSIAPSPTEPQRSRQTFSALQRAENSSMCQTTGMRRIRLTTFSALQRAENSSIAACDIYPATHAPLSVLFSEPKIPQSPGYLTRRLHYLSFQCSSASRKFLNSSRSSISHTARVAFQCSSASRKFLNSSTVRNSQRRSGAFSALQRAENSSIQPPAPARPRFRERFQCSSASRKFLNLEPTRFAPLPRLPFSALQRAENSSMRLD